MSTLVDRPVAKTLHALPTGQPDRSVVSHGSDRCAACGGAMGSHLLDLGPVPVLPHPEATTPTDDTWATAPLALARCDRCGVVQIAGRLSDEARHLVATATTRRAFAGRPDCARRFCEEAIDRWKLTGAGHIIEIGSGTGSLLRFFRAWQLPVLGIEPDARLTRYGRVRRIPTWRCEFDAAAAGRIARADLHADLIVISTPLGAFAQLPQTFAAVSAALRPGGVVTFEIPDVLRLVGRTRLDGMRHADRVVPSVRQLQRMLAPSGLDIIDVERAETADDRLRIWARGQQRGVDAIAHPRLRTRLRAEACEGVDRADIVAAFVRRAELVVRHVRALLDDAARQGRRVAAFGASPDAVTIAAAAGVNRQRVEYAVDPERSPTLRHLPGSDVPMVGLVDAADRRPDLVLGLDAPDALPAEWTGVPIYAVTDLVDVVHRLTTDHAVHFAR